MCLHAGRLSSQRLVVRCEAPERSAFLVDVGNSGVPQSIGVKLKRAGYWILASRSDGPVKIFTLMPTMDGGATNDERWVCSAEDQRLTLTSERPLLGGRLPAFPKWIGRIVVTAAAAEEHQGHQPAPDEERKEGSEAKGDPAVLIHHGVASEVPHRRSPEASEQEQDGQRYEKSDLAKAKASHGLRLLR